MLARPAVHLVLTSQFSSRTSHFYSVKPYPQPLDLGKIKVFPLAKRDSLSSIDKILVQPGQAPAPCSAQIANLVEECSGKIKAARNRGASVMLLYGAHLIKNG